MSISLDPEVVISRFPNYSINRIGDVRNIESGKIMSEHLKKSRLRKGLHVRLRRNGTQYSVAVRDLLEETFPEDKD